jgi:hypothetical protein
MLHFIDSYFAAIEHPQQLYPNPFVNMAYAFMELCPSALLLSSPLPPSAAKPLSNREEAHNEHTVLRPASPRGASVTANRSLSTRRIEFIVLFPSE